MKNDKRPKISFPLDKPVILTFMHDLAVADGEGKFGKWHMYNVREGEEEKVLFLNEPSQLLTDLKLQGIRQGRTFKIIKRAKEADGRVITFYEVERPDSEEKFSDSLDKMTYEEVKTNKDELITRLALAKSMIESGEKELTPDILVSLQHWLEWVKTGSITTLDNYEQKIKEKKEIEEITKDL